MPQANPGLGDAIPLGLGAGGFRGRVTVRAEVDGFRWGWCLGGWGRGRAGTALIRGLVWRGG